MTGARRPAAALALAVALGAALACPPPAGARAGDPARARALAALRAEVEAAPARLDLLYRLSALEEADGDLPAALATARRILAAGETYDARLRVAWLSLLTGDLPAAEEGYARAAALEPASEDAWLGLQRARLARRDWAGAEAAGARVLALHPESTWALARLGLAAYMQGRYRDAEARYAAALAARPGDPEALLGLGFTRVRLGDEAGGHRLCREAAAGLPAADARVADCLALEARGVRVAATASYTAVHRAAPWDLGDTHALAFTAGATWPWGVGAWAGATLSRTELRYARDDYRQASPVVGVGLARGPVRARAAAALVLADDEAVDRTPVLLGGAAWWAPEGGAGLDVAWSAYADGTRVLQLDPALQWRPREALELRAGARLTRVASDPGAPRGDETLLAGRLGLTARPHPRLALFAEGAAGRERYGVDDGGLTLWTRRDRYVGAWRAGLAWTAARPVVVFAEAWQRFGDEQPGRSRSFHLTGGTLGLRLGR